MRRTEIFWLGLEALPREIRATEWRSLVKAPSDVQSRSTLTHLENAAISKSGIKNPLFELSGLFELLGHSSKTFGTFQKSQKSPKISHSMKISEPGEIPGISRQ